MFNEPHKRLRWNEFGFRVQSYSGDGDEVRTVVCGELEEAGIGRGEKYIVKVFKIEQVDQRRDRVPNAAKRVLREEGNTGPPERNAPQPERCGPPRLRQNNTGQCGGDRVTKRRWINLIWWGKRESRRGGNPRCVKWRGRESEVV